MLACSAHCGPSVDADASVRHLSALWSCAAAGAAKRNFVVADFYFLEMSYLPGPISPPVLEMSYLPSRTRFLSPHTVLYEHAGCFLLFTGFRQHNFAVFAAIAAVVAEGTAVSAPFAVL